MNQNLSYHLFVILWCTVQTRYGLGPTCWDGHIILRALLQVELKILPIGKRENFLLSLFAMQLLSPLQ